MDGKTLRNKLIGSDDERAVSPVIGVILMVAITVILAAVIATLVMDFGDSVNQDAQAGVTFDQQEDGTITATWQSEGNANDIEITHDGADDVCFEVGSDDAIDAVGTTVTNSSSCDTVSSINAVAVNEDSRTTVASFDEFDG